MKETLVICIEDIVSNSILELYKITGIPSTSLKQAELYGRLVIKELKKNKIDVILLTSSDYIKRFEIIYKDWFYVNNDGYDSIYTLNKNKTINELNYFIHNTTPIKLITGFINQKVIDDWLDVIGYEKKLTKKY